MQTWLICFTPFNGPFTTRESYCYVGLEVEAQRLARELGFRGTYAEVSA